MAEHRPIFIIGCERSGTTLLRAMLNAHPNIAMPYEACRFSRMVSVQAPWEHVWAQRDLDTLLESILSHWKVKFWAPPKEAILGSLSQRMSFRYPNILEAIYKAYARREGKSRWGDKTPANTFDLPHLIRAFPEAQFIHLVRDGRDVYLSWLKADWARYDVPTAAKKWKGWVWCASRPGRMLSFKQYYQLRYEDLIANPRDRLRAVCHFLGEPFVEDMLRYHENQRLVPEERKSFHRLLSQSPEASRAYRWKREMDDADVRLFERIAGATLLKYGYEVSPAMRTTAFFTFALQQVRQRIKDLVTPAMTT